MRVCPKCGYKELIWKHCGRGFRFTDYCHISELEAFEPNVAEKVKQTPKFYTDGIFNYCLKPCGIVHKIWKDDAISPNSMKEPDMEKPKNITPFIKTIKRDKLPPKQQFVPIIREALKGHATVLDSLIGKNTWRHWIRDDNSGFSYPSIKDWKKVQQNIVTPTELDDMILSVSIMEQTKLLEITKVERVEQKQ